MNENFVFTLTPLFESPQGDDEVNQSYRNIILKTLKKILPAYFFLPREISQCSIVACQHYFKDELPLISLSYSGSFPGIVSFFALSKYRSNSFKFFFEMISRWLTPGRRLNVVLVCASDFRLNELPDDVYTICQVTISLTNAIEFEEIQRNFPIIQEEIVLGIPSAFYAQRILEIKGLSADDKTATIQGTVAYLIKRFPDLFQIEFLNEMQHFLVTCSDSFKFSRKARHLSRIITLQYLFRKKLVELAKKHPRLKHFVIKIFRSSIQQYDQSKPVLALLLGYHSGKDRESMSEKTILKAIQSFIIGAQIISHSFLQNQSGIDHVSFCYIEFAKQNGTLFTFAEIAHLKKHLPAELSQGMDQRLHPLFMPRNEEEIMRNMLILSEQIKFVKDIPQTSISFDEQSHSHIYFTVILARLLKSQVLPIYELFKKTPSVVEFIPDRVKIIGQIRKKYPKEVSVFHLKIKKENFLRHDQSIDLYKARQTVLKELTKIIGEIRDYNGGIISKQYELFSRINALLVDKEYDELLLENFFYSLAPVIIRALLQPGEFKTLFSLLTEGVNEYKQEGEIIKIHTDEKDHVYILVISDDLHLRELLQRRLQDLQIQPRDLIDSYIKMGGLAYISYLYREKSRPKKELLIKAIQNQLERKKVQIAD